MTTLADLTPEQLHECVGMWCDFIPGDGDSDKEPELGIFAYWQWATNEAIITRPDLADTRKWCFPENVTPRFDLPRAWNPDGTPVSDHITDLEEIADEYRNHCLANGDDNTVAWIDRKRGELDAD